MATIQTLKALKDIRGSGVELVQRIEPSGVYRIEAPPLAFPGPIDPANPRWQDSFVTTTEAVSPAVEVYRVRECLVSVDGVVMTFSNFILRESLYPYVHLPDVLAAFRGTLTTIDGDPGDDVRMTVRGISRCWDSVLFAREHGEAGYFHWLHSVLPRIEIYRRMNLLPRRLSVALTEPFQDQSLAFLGLGRDDLQISDGHAGFFEEIYYCTPMVVPDVSRSGGFFERPLWAARMLRDLAGGIERTAGKRIYVSRRDARIRRLEREDELVRRLDSLGFAEATLTGMPFREQIELFSSAEMIVSMHGAGLSNIAFMAPNSAVIEVLAQDRLWPTYRGVAARSGLRYFPYVGHRTGQCLETDSDIALDIDHFVDFTKQALAA